MSTIEVAKRSMRFKTAGERPRCGNCCNREVSGNGQFGREDLRCKRGGFFVGPYAICDHHQVERRGSEGAAR